MDIGTLLGHLKKFQHDATGILYDNDTSGLAATNVQVAIDELSSGGPSASAFGYILGTSGDEIEASYPHSSAYFDSSDSSIQIIGNNATNTFDFRVNALVVKHDGIDATQNAIPKWLSNIGHILTNSGIKIDASDNLQIPDLSRIEFGRPELYMHGSATGDIFNIVNNLSSGAQIWILANGTNPQIEISAIGGGLTFRSNIIYFLVSSIEFDGDFSIFKTGSSVFIVQDDLSPDTHFQVDTSTPAVYASSLEPTSASSSTKDLGTSSNKWRDLYMSGYANIATAQLSENSESAGVTVTIDVSNKSGIRKWTASQNETVNISGTHSSGRILIMRITCDATPRTITWGTGFVGVAPSLVLTPSKVSHVFWLSDGSNFYELSQSTGV